MLVVRFSLFQKIAIPINVKLFGENKTLRGLITMVVLNAFFASLFFAILDIHIFIKCSPFLYGAFVGFSYILFELPNSYMKRRLGVAPGEKSHKSKKLFVFIDRFDSPA